MDNLELKEVLDVIESINFYLDEFGTDEVRNPKKVLEAVKLLTNTLRIKIAEERAYANNAASVIIHYRNLAIALGAKPDDMLSLEDRRLCEDFDPVEAEEYCDRDFNASAWRTYQETLNQIQLELFGILNWGFSGKGDIDDIKRALKEVWGKIHGQ